MKVTSIIKHLKRTVCTKKTCKTTSTEEETVVSSKVNNVRPLIPMQLDSKGIRRPPIVDLSLDLDNDIAPLPLSPKSETSKRVLSKALKQHFLFSLLEKSDIENIIGVMTRTTIKKEEDIITQGDRGNSFYVLESGNCNIVIHEKIVGRYGDGDAFGELALLYNCPRAATIRATSPCVLWSIERIHFRKILAATASKEQLAKCEFLKNVPLLQSLDNIQLHQIAGALKTYSFDNGMSIIRQGEIGESFYIIRSGIVVCTQFDVEVGSIKNLMTLSTGDYFGEMALLLNEPRHANCVARGPVECYCLNRQQFIDLLGPLRDILDRQMRIRVLRNVPLFASLSDNELNIVAHALRVITFHNGQNIITEGEIGDTFYIINEGEVHVSKGNINMMTLKAGEFFGERALLKKEPRAATCVAVGKVECLSMKQELFENLLGKLDQLIGRAIQKQEYIQLSKNNLLPVTLPKISMSDLIISRTIGTGTFGRVILVIHKVTKKAMAMKCMQKATLVSTFQQRNVLQEKKILSECSHPFILKLYHTLSDKDQVFMMFELVQGGELWSLLYEKADSIQREANGGFHIDAVRFYSGNIIHALLYLQKQGIAYRDLKPENLLLDADGYIKLVDFGFAKRIPFSKGGVVCHRSFTLCGTPEYLSPELVLSKGHGKAVDYWALGCLIYELIAGKNPFQDEDPQKIFKNILSSQNCLSFPKNFDPQAKDLVLKLLHPNAAMRIGALAGGVQDIMDHPWFLKFDWDALVLKKIKAPFVPLVESDHDISHFDQYPEDVSVVPYDGPTEYFEGF